MLLILIVTFCCAIISYIKIKNDTENHNIRIINKILFIHPLQPDICFVTKVAWTVAANAAPF